MKLVVVLVCFSVFQAAAFSGRAQTVTLKVKDVTLESVISSLKDQTGFSFIYDPAALAGAGHVTLDLKNVQLKDALDACFKGQPLEFIISSNVVAIRQRNASGDVVKPVVSTIDVTGRVVDEQGTPLATVTVQVKGTTNATITDAKGYFQLKGVVSKTIIIVSIVGYERKEISAVENVGDIMLVVATSKLDEVHVIAYGQSSQRLSIGNISSVSAKEIQEQPVGNPILALEGRVPGLFITQTNGISGSGVTVRIEGKNSILKGNDPLYIIDGVPYMSQSLPTISGVLGSSGGISDSGSGNPLSFINPDDIESVDILKDADATSIYGSRAANGAILITTKRGKAGATKFEANLQNGWGEVSHMLPLMNTQQYLTMRLEAKKNDNAAISSTDYDINGIWDQSRYTDWQKTLIGGKSNYSDFNGTISGGSVSSQYMIGGTFHRETTVFPGDFADVKGGLHFNLNNTSENRKLHMQLSAYYLLDNNQLPNTDLTRTAVTLAPDAPALYANDGSLNWQPNSSGSSTWTNPLSYLYKKYHYKTGNLISNLSLSYQLLPGLDILSSFGYTNQESNETYIQPLLSAKPEVRGRISSVALYGNSNTNSWIAEPQVKYKHNIGKGVFEALLGSTIYQTNSNGQQLQGVGYSSDLVLADIHSASNVQANAAIASVYKYNALFGRLNYNFDDRYIINITGRRDGSSRFGPNIQVHNFGSVGGAWVFSQEEFVKRNFSFLEFGKLHMSYGTTGNDQIGDYQYLNQYTATSAEVPYQGITGLEISSLPNPYISWEETKKIQLGLDLGFLKNRILFNVGYYDNTTSNQLLSYALPILTGFSSVIENFPATVRNSGWELMLATTQLKTKSFLWSSSINLTIPFNKLLSFPNLSTSSYANQYIVGEPITVQKKYHSLGADPQTGVAMVSDRFGNPTTSPDGILDHTVLINSMPRFYGGIQNTFKYKNIELNVLFQFVKQSGPNYFFGIYPGYVGTNQPIYLLDRWQKPGDISQHQRYNSNFSLISTFFNAAESDAAYSDASYIRLKNLSLSWAVPAGLTKKVGLRSCKVFIQGQNLLTITNYKGLDPETLSSTTLPTLRFITVGLHVGI